MALQQFCTFYLDRLFFGVNVLNVQEVIRNQEMTRIPLAPDVLRGLINLRGQIVTALDLRERLCLPPKEANDDFMNVIINSSDAAVSLLVDEVGEVIEVDESDFEPPPHHLDNELKALVDGVYKLDQQLMLVLNTDKTVDLEIQILAQI